MTIGEGSTKFLGVFHGFHSVCPNSLTTGWNKMLQKGFQIAISGIVRHNPHAKTLTVCVVYYRSINGQVFRQKRKFFDADPS